MGVSVTGRITKVKQPRGGFINPKSFDVISVTDDDGIVLQENENIHPSLVGLVVDYMTRFMLTNNIKESFKISILGAMVAEKIGVKDAIKIVESLMLNIKGLDKQSIINACKLVSFDVWYRNPISAIMSKKYDEINADDTTIANIQCMIQRSIEFFKIYGPIKQDGFSFEPVNGNKDDYDKMIKTNTGTYGGYTATVSTGDGDFLTTDTLWDFKVSKSAPTSKHTLQLLMYWVMGQHSGQEVFKNISKLGIFNPRLNKVYIYDTTNISKDIIDIVEKEVICY